LCSYAQELPSRCKKEIIKAADKNGNGIITEEALCTMIDNIGASSRVSRSDIDNIIKELGDRSKSTIGAEKVLQII
jgi:Ca2+-binding EF-hand superfamily protein